MAARAPKYPGIAGYARNVRHQPDYPASVPDEYLEHQRKQIDLAKPEGFKLTPITEAGW